MSQNSSRKPTITGPRAAATLFLVGMVGLGVWWGRRAAFERDLGRALAGFADAGLPLSDAPVDDALADLGADVFDRRCAACHALAGVEKLGPNLGGVTRRRELPWIRSMILRPDSMTRDDAVASELKARYGAQMMVMGELTEAHVLAVVEFLRRSDRGNAP